MPTRVELIDRLVEIGIDQDEAAKIVDDLTEKVKNALPTIANDEEKLYKKVSSYVAAFKRKYQRFGDIKHTGLVIAIGDRRDIFERLKRIAMVVYEKDKNRAIMEGYVEVDDLTGEVHPLDWRKTLYSGKENPNYGKRLRTAYSRDVYIVEEGRLRILQGDFEDGLFEVGKIYEFAATERDGEIYLRFSSVLPVREIGKVSDIELWESAVQGLIAEEALMEVSQLEDTNSYVNVAVRGEVVDYDESSRGTIILLEDVYNPLGEPVTVFCRETINNIDFGQEVIVIGQYVYREDNDERRIYALSVIPNPNKKVVEIDVSKYL